MSFTRSSRVSYGEDAGTTTTSGSSVSFAIGVVSSIRVSAEFVSTAPTMTSPMTMRLKGSRSFAKEASPTVPPAPPILETGAESTRPSAVRSSDSARAVWSHPPPGSAGAMSCTESGAATASPPSVLSAPAFPPCGLHPASAMTASAAIPAVTIRLRMSLGSPLSDGGGTDTASGEGKPCGSGTRCCESNCWFSKYWPLAQGLTLPRLVAGARPHATAPSTSNPASSHVGGGPSSLRVRHRGRAPERLTGPRRRRASAWLLPAISITATLLQRFAGRR